MRLEPVIAGLGLGGNVGDVAKAMLHALQLINSSQGCSISTVSRLYATPPWGKTDQDWFINACALVETTLDIHALLDLAQMAERAAGRERRERWGPRTLDIDILFFGDAITADDRLTVPHKHMLERAFVLVPLAEIAGDRVVQGQTINHWSRMIDNGDMALSDRQFDLSDVKSGV